MSKLSDGTVKSTASVSPRAISLSTGLPVVLFLMGLWGCLSIYNATVYHSAPYFYAGRQLLWLLLGILLMHFCAKLPFAFYRKNIFPIAGLMYGLLLLVLLFGVRRNGMRGWFEFGSCLIQPSEFAKPVFILLLCCCSRQRSGSSGKALKMLLLTGIFLFPLIMQPDFGMAMIYLAAFVVVYYLAGLSWRWFLISLSILAPLLLYLTLRHAYVVTRLSGFWNPDADPFGSGWHILQFQYTLARGGWFGTDWGQSLWANAYLPLAHSDSVFASLVEALGFVGALPVILAFPALAVAAYRLAGRTDDCVAAIYTFVFPMVIMIQAFIHISVNVGLVPPTGITLPLFSYGGSSLVSTLMGFGILLSASNSHHEQDAA